MVNPEEGGKCHQLLIKYSNFRFPNLWQIYLNADKQTHIKLRYYLHQEIWNRFYKGENFRRKEVQIRTHYYNDSNAPLLRNQ